MRQAIVVASLVIALLVPAILIFADTDVPFVAQVGEDGVQRVEIIGGDYFFKPRIIVVKVNVPVELVFKKEPGFKPHNIKMDASEAAMKFDVDLKDKKWQSVRFTPKKTGVYPFICDKRLLFFKSHREKGMQGELRVVD